MVHHFAKVSEEEIVAINEAAFFYPSDLVNTKTSTPQSRWKVVDIYLDALRWLYIITHKIISEGSHLIKLITRYKIGRWLSDDIHRPIWYLSSDFNSMEGKPRNKWTFKLKLLISQGKPKKSYRTQWWINKKLVDNSVLRNMKKSTKYAGTIYVHSPWEIILRVIK